MRNGIRLPSGITSVVNSMGAPVQRVRDLTEDGSDPLPSRNGLKWVPRFSERDGARRNHLAIEGIDRIENLGLDHGAGPFGCALGQV